MSCHAKVMGDLACADLCLHENQLGCFFVGWVVTIGPDGAEGIEHQRPGQGVHDTQRAVSGGGFGGRPLQCVPSPSRAVNGYQYRARIFAHEARRRLSRVRFKGGRGRSLPRRLGVT
jgi:hypothetical protein